MNKKCTFIIMLVTVVILLTGLSYSADKKSTESTCCPDKDPCCPSGKKCASEKSSPAKLASCPDKDLCCPSGKKSASEKCC